MMRIEKDSLGSLEVANDRLWGAQTQRALENFSISDERLPQTFIIALAQVKRACAVVNQALGRLPGDRASAIVAAADEVISGGWAQEFPLSVWQTGSGTQTHMNVNEVLANRASELMGGERGIQRCVHPNDDVNLGQSSNDVFPTAMHLAVAIAFDERLHPALQSLSFALHEQAERYRSLIKIGRTHLQDATPLTLGQALSGMVAQLALAEQSIRVAQTALWQLAIGGTAVGTGLNTHAEFGDRVATELAARCGLPLTSAENKFAALAGHEPLLASHAALKTLACSLIKIANDLRWLASGPRAGLGEISLPENEPGSSIMPGKVNPTQLEALLMLCYQVIGNDVTLSMAAASGNFELNVAKPVIAYVHLQSLTLLADGMNSLTLHCVRGLRANPERMAENLSRSLMLVTALVPHIGYDRAAEIARCAHSQGLTLRAAALQLAYVSALDFDRWVQAENMLAPDSDQVAR